MYDYYIFLCGLGVHFSILDLFREEPFLIQQKKRTTKVKRSTIVISVSYKHINGEYLSH